MRVCAWMGVGVCVQWVAVCSSPRAQAEEQM